MTDAVITDLAKIGALRVIPRTSVMRYKRTQKSVPVIARELNVDAIIEGSIEHAGNRVRISAQLIRGATDQHLWAEAYDREMCDMLRVQEEIARSIAREFQVKLTPQEQALLTKGRPIDPQAYELYLKGRYFWTKATKESIGKAMGLIYLGLSRITDAFQWLEKACAERSNVLIYANVDHRLDSIRSDPRFQDLLRRFGLH